MGFVDPRRRQIVFRVDFVSLCGGLMHESRGPKICSCLFVYLEMCVRCFPKGTFYDSVHIQCITVLEEDVVHVNLKLSRSWQLFFLFV